MDAPRARNSSIGSGRGRGRPARTRLRAPERQRRDRPALRPARQAGRPLLLPQGRHARVHEAGLRRSATTGARSRSRARSSSASAPTARSRTRSSRQKYGLPFTLLADPDHELAEQYGFWVEKNNYGKKYMGVERSTVVIDADGNVEQGLPARQAGRARATSLNSARLAVFDLKTGLLFAAAVAAVFFPAAASAVPTGGVEVVVTLDAPPLAQAIQRSRVLSARVKAQRLNLRAPTSVALPPLARDRAARARRADHHDRPRRPRHLALPGRARRPRRRRSRAPSSGGLPPSRASRRSGRASPTGRCSTGARS